MKGREERCSRCLWGDKCCECGICTYYTPLDEDYALETNEDFADYYKTWIKYISDFT